jgi:F-type H+-transporting ATPase subunit a
MGNPLEHFELHRLIPISLFGIDISINEAVVMMWVVVFTVFGLFWLASRDMKSIPGRLQSMVEVAVEFLRG